MRVAVPADRRCRACRRATGRRPRARGRRTRRAPTPGSRGWCRRARRSSPAGRAARGRSSLPTGSARPRRPLPPSGLVPAAFSAASAATANVSRTPAPSMPALTAAATAAAPASATPVLCVTKRRLDHAVDERVPDRHGDADRRDPHRRPVRRAAEARLGGIDARGQRGERPLRGRAEQTRRSALPHRRLPRRQPSRQLARVDPTARLDHQPPEQGRLLGVVGDRARGEPLRDRMARRRRVEAVDEQAVPLHDPRPRRRLGRHAQRVPDGEAVQGAAGPVGRHGRSALRTTRTSGP